MIRRRAVCQWLGAGAAVQSIASAQSPSRAYRLGELDFGHPYTAPAGSGPPPLPDPLTPELERLGLIAGANLAIDIRSAHGDLARLDAIAAELVANRPDVLFTGSGFACARALKNATKTIPIVFSAIGEPVAAGLVASLSHPGGNLTGGALPAELELKRIEILIEVLGQTAAVAVLTAPLPGGRMTPMRNALVASRLRVRFQEVRQAEDLAPAFEQMARQRIGGVAIVHSPFTWLHRSEIGMLLAKYRLPAIADVGPFIDPNVMITYSIDWAEVMRRAARTIHKILMGAKPADLPVEQIEKFEFVINVKTASALGVRIPTAVRLRATRVIE